MMKTINKAKLLIASLICHPVVGRTLLLIFKRKIPSNGFSVDVSNPYVSPANVARIFWGIYEKPEIRFVRRFLKPDLDVVELGSSLGVVSLNILRVQKSERKLICVEANPHLVKTIEKNIAFNFPRKKVQILNRAISYSGMSEVHFEVDEGNLGSRVAGSASAHSVSIATTTLLNILNDNNIQECALVADIEGAEAGIIMNDLAALALCRQLIIELHPTNFDGESYRVDELRSQIELLHGYECVDRHHDVYFFQK